MGLKAGTPITDITLDRVFIGSCTNGRIEDLRAVAKVVEGKTVADSVDAMIVPGSGLVKEMAEAEGLDKIFMAAGFDWREPGCSMCLAMNDDRLKPEERCASTSNRNFEGRQGFKGRTHLVSPAMAAAAAIAGHFVDIGMVLTFVDGWTSFGVFRGSTGRAKGQSDRLAIRHLGRGARPLFDGNNEERNAKPSVGKLVVGKWS